MLPKYQKAKAPARNTSQNTCILKVVWKIPGMPLFNGQVFFVRISSAAKDHVCVILCVCAVGCAGRVEVSMLIDECTVAGYT